MSDLDRMTRQAETIREQYHTILALREIIERGLNATNDAVAEARTRGAPPGALDPLIEVNGRLLMEMLEHDRR